MAKETLELWQGIPADTRCLLLSNVWCGECRKAFELFVDIGEEGRPGAKGVKKTKISQAFDSVGEKLIMLFDYGDGWQFNVELKEIHKIRDYLCLLK